MNKEQFIAVKLAGGFDTVIVIGETLEQAIATVKEKHGDVKGAEEMTMYIDFIDKRGTK